jgi:hypothetical protein
MKKIGVNGDVKREDYDTWPVFKEFRKTPEFVATYEEVFKTKYETADVPPVVSGLLAEASQTSKRSGEKRILRRRRARQ